MAALRPRGGGEFGSSRGLTFLVLDREAIFRLNLPGGQTWSWARNLGIEVEEVAKGLLTPGAGYVTGDLQRSVGSSTVPVGEGVQVNVRATSNHAIFYIKGSRPHPIESNRPNGWMRWWDASGKVFARHVEHPGFGGRNFLNEAKDAVLLRRGIT